MAPGAPRVACHHAGQPADGTRHAANHCRRSGYDVFVAFASLAAVTNTLRFGTNVFNVGLRHPFVTARAVATLDMLSRGRLELGIGASWLEEEWQAVEWDFKTGAGEWTRPCRCGAACGRPTRTSRAPPCRMADNDVSIVSWDFLEAVHPDEPTADSPARSWWHRSRFLAARAATSRHFWCVESPRPLRLGCSTRGVRRGSGGGDRQAGYGRRPSGGVRADRAPRRVERRAARRRRSRSTGGWRTTSRRRAPQLGPRR